MMECRVGNGDGVTEYVSDSPPSSSPKNQQFSRLNAFRRERLLVDIYLVSGVRLRGRIKSFDQYSLILDVGQGETFLYHHAVSSVGPVQGKAAHTRKPGGPPRGRLHEGGGGPYSGPPGGPGRDDRPPPRSDSRPPAHFAPRDDDFNRDAPSYPRRPLTAPRAPSEVPVVRRVSRKVTLPPKDEPPTGSS